MARAASRSPGSWCFCPRSDHGRTVRGVGGAGPLQSRGRSEGNPVSSSFSPPSVSAARCSRTRVGSRPGASPFGVLMRRSSVAALLAILMLVTAPPRTAHAQFFGKNKVQYEPLDWSVLETPHLRVHYYAEEESLARRLTPFAESTCVEYDRRFRITSRRQIPVMLYSTHHLFQQTNATPGLISEATGGLTELIKGRVLIPHNGSWARLLWVTRHELTHAYMLEKLSRVMREHHRTQSYFPPLWFTEGLAEYCGTTWDADAEGLMRDAILTHEALPLTRSDAITGTVLMYKDGQSFLLYLAEHYGDRRIFDLMDNWYRGDDFESVFRITIGR